MILMVKGHHETIALFRSFDDDLQASIEPIRRQEATVLNERDESLMPN